MQARVAATTVRAAVLEASARLASAGIEDARVDAELLLAEVLGVARTALRLSADRELASGEEAAYAAMVARRSQREPIQYILGRTGFRTLEVEVDRRVLIPRPETEQLVGAVLEWSGRTGRWGRVADIGTGSGAIALSLAAEGSFDRIVATDVSAAALEVARCNASRLGHADRIAFRTGALFDALGEETTFDVIVSNPPYVAEEDAPGLMPEVGEWEPPVALFADCDGLGVLNALIDGAARWLEEGGLLALEIGHGQGEQVRRRAADRGYEGIRGLRDLAGRERIILAERGRRVVRGTTGDER